MKTGLAVSNPRISERSNVAKHSLSRHMLWILFEQRNHP